MEKEPVKKTIREQAEEAFVPALMSAGIVLVVLLFLWIPFKVLPALFGNGSNFVATTLSSLIVSDSATSTSETSDKSTSTDKLSNSNTQIQKSYFGKPDLEVSLISTGVIDPASKQYIQTNYAGYNDEIGMKFQVKNIGTNVSGPWKLRINAPSRTTPYFDSEYQVSIKPGDKIIFTATFDSPSYVGLNTAYITADPLNEVVESSENNNLLNVLIRIDGTYYTYSNNYNYGSNAVVSNLPYGSLYTWTSMSINCYAGPTMTSVGRPVTWYATASGGNGYYSYSWVGSDQLYSNESSVDKIYYSTGTKLATVTVTSGGQSVTKQCSTNIVN